ncbi:MAG: rhomboid family intramembrane serine protease GlpG [Psychromonas sp.]|nr:rhomboid family intramembrane serine protease GlpG [Psychromonas sp.]
MFTLHHFHNLRAAQAFSDYLNATGIKNQIQHDEFTYLILVEQNIQKDLAEKELELFLQNPVDSKYLSASWQTGSITENSNHLDYLHSNLMTNFISRGGLISHSIFAVCVLIYVLTSLGLLTPMQSVFAFFREQPFDYSQSWRFVTPAFLHFSILHITFNLLWWWELAGIIEKHHGKLRLILLFLFAAITSNLAQYYLVGPYFGGLSGVVYGLVGYCWLFGILNKNSKVNLPNAYFLFLIGWLMLGFINILPVNVANYAHLAGLLAGLLLAGVSSKLNI